VKRLKEIYQAIAGDLERAGYSSAVIGGLAVSVRSEPRFTRDVDLAVAVNGDSESEALVRHLIVSGYGVEAMIEQHETGRFATARLIPGGGGRASMLVDLLFASTGIEPEIVAQATNSEIWPGIYGRVARTGHLIALKLLSRAPRRPQDHVDLVNLLLVADAEERALAYEAAWSIEQRGYARGRNLCADLDALIKELELP